MDTGGRTGTVAADARSVPEALRRPAMWGPCLDPPGTILVAREPTACPDCQTARAFFWAGTEEGRLRYCCLSCMRH